MRSSLLAAATAIAILPFPVQAQESEGVIERLNELMLTDRHAAAHIEAFKSVIERRSSAHVLQTMLSTVFTIAPDGDLTEAKADLHLAKEKAKRRGQRIGRFLAHDLNGDGMLDQEERASVTGPEAVAVEMLFVNGDRDGDGVITVSEIAQHEDEDRQNPGLESLIAILLAMDLDQNGVSQPQEIVTAIGLLNELGPVPNQRTGVQAGRTGAQQETCSAPKPDDTAQIIVLSSYESDALSTVTVAGLDDVTHVSRIEIEPGEAPLYVMVASYEHMIWQFSGATDRLVHVVVQARRSEAGLGAGVTGVSEDKITFVGDESCLKRVESIEGAEGLIAFKRAEHNLGRAPDLMFANYTIGSVSLPSGSGLSGKGGSGQDTLVLNGRSYAITPNGLEPLDETEGQLPGQGEPGVTQTLRSLQRFSPGGVQPVDEAAVIAPGAAATYDVLPQQAGLLQLLLDGKLRYTRDGYYLIEKPIPHFPAGLYGAHSVRFMLGVDIEMPAGSAGHSSVVSAQTGDCLSRTCR